MKAHVDLLGMDLTHDEHQLLLEGLWALSVTRLEDDPEERGRDSSPRVEARR